MALIQGLVAGGVPAWGTGVGGSRCLCASRVPLEDRRVGSRGAQSGVLAWDAWSDGLGDPEGRRGIPACLQPWNPLTALLCGVLGVLGTLGAVCAMWQVVPRWCWMGTKVAPLPPSPLTWQLFVQHLPGLSPHTQGAVGRGQRCSPAPCGAKACLALPFPEPGPCQAQAGFPESSTAHLPWTEQVLGDRVRDHIFGEQLPVEAVLGHF